MRRGCRASWDYRAEGKWIARIFRETKLFLWDYSLYIGIGGCDEQSYSFNERKNKNKVPVQKYELTSRDREHLLYRNGNCKVWGHCFEQPSILGSSALASPLKAPPHGARSSKRSRRPNACNNAQ